MQAFKMQANVWETLVMPSSCRSKNWLIKNHSVNQWQSNVNIMIVFELWRLYCVLKVCIFNAWLASESLYVCIVWFCIPRVNESICLPTSQRFWCSCIWRSDFFSKGEVQIFQTWEDWLKEGEREFEIVCCVVGRRTGEKDLKEKLINPYERESDPWGTCMTRTVRTQPAAL